MAVNRFRVESALMRSAVVALTVLTLTLFGAPELAAQQEGSEVSTQSTDDDSKKKKKQKKLLPHSCTSTTSTSFTFRALDKYKKTYTHISLFTKIERVKQARVPQS